MRFAQRETRILRNREKMLSWNAGLYILSTQMYQIIILDRYPFEKYCFNSCTHFPHILEGPSLLPRYDVRLEKNPRDGCEMRTTNSLGHPDSERQKQFNYQKHSSHTMSSPRVPSSHFECAERCNLCCRSFLPLQKSVQFYVHAFLSLSTRCSSLFLFSCKERQCLNCITPRK